MNLPLNSTTPRMRGVLLAAARHAQASGHEYIGTEHMLWALAGDRDGLARQVLNSLGVREAVASKVGEVIAASGGESTGSGPVGNPLDEVCVELDGSDRLANFPLRMRSANAAD